MREENPDTDTTDRSPPISGGTLRECAVIVSGFGGCAVLAEVFLTQLTWLLVGCIHMLLFVAWLVLIGRGMARTGRAVGSRRGLRPLAVYWTTVIVLVPVMSLAPARLNLFFWSHRDAFERAALAAEAGQFVSPTEDRRDALLLPQPLQSLVQGRTAKVIASNGERYVVFEQAGLAGEFMGYCRVGTRCAPAAPYRATPVLGTGGIWYRVSLD